MSGLPDTFVAEDDGPPRRRFWIVRDAANRPEGTVRGWSFVFDEWRDGRWHVGGDSWERWFFEILRYPPAYASAALRWHIENDNKAVDLDVLQEMFDGVRAHRDNTPYELGLER